MPKGHRLVLPLGLVLLVLSLSADARGDVPFGPQVRVRVTSEGDLEIRGDDGDNDVTIGQPPGGGTMLRVVVPPGQWLNDTPGPASILFDGVTQGLRANLGQGDDVIEIFQVELAGDAKVDLGEGSNFVRLFDSTVGGDFAVKAKGGHDTLSNTAGRVGGDCRVDLGDGDNVIRLDLFARGEMKLKTKSGLDSISLSDHSGAAGNVKIESGGGRDVIFMRSGTEAGGKLHVDTGDGDDEVIIERCATFGGDAHFDLGKGDDTLDAMGLLVAGDLHVDAGHGADVVRIGPSPASGCPRSMLLGDARVKLGDGDDTFEIGETDVGGDLDADGGKDEDTFVDAGGNAFAVPPRIEHFETLVP